MSRSPDELVDVAWGLVEEALTKGTITLRPHGLPEETKIAVDGIMDLAKFLATLKVKKPQLIRTPEDFNLKETKVYDNDEED